MRERGFTLVEVLVALMIVSFTLVVISSHYLTTLDRLQRVERREQALLLGDYLLLRGRVLDYGGGNGQGVDGTFHWSSEERLLQSDQRRFSALTEVRVRVFDKRGGALFDATTRRLKLLR